MGTLFLLVLETCLILSNPILVYNMLNDQLNEHNSLLGHSAKIKKLQTELDKHYWRRIRMDRQRTIKLKLGLCSEKKVKIKQMLGKTF